MTHTPPDTEKAIPDCVREAAEALYDQFAYLKYSDGTSEPSLSLDDVASLIEYHCKVGEMREALAFYADAKTWQIQHSDNREICSPSGLYCHCSLSPATEDEGERARQALHPTERKEQG